MPLDVRVAGQPRSPDKPEDLAQRLVPAAVWAVPLLLCLGLALRIAMALPSYKYQVDADAILTALCAFKVMRWEHPVFYVAERIGSLGGHLTALLFSLFGVSRSSLAAETVLSSALMLGAWYLFLREALGRRLALLALPFAAFPSPAFLFWTSTPAGGYPETLLFCASSLWLAARLVRGDRSPWSVFGFGLSVGLAWWASLLSLGCTFPALLWLAWRRRDLLQRHAIARFIAGFLLGALPWLAFNVRHPLASLRQTALIRPVPGRAALLDNARYLATFNLRELVASVAYDERPSAVSLALQRPVLAMVGMAALTSLLVFPLWRCARRRQRRESRASSPASSALPLLALVAVAALLLVLLTVAGTDRGLPVRYLLPLYLVIPALIAVALAALASRLPAAAAACAVAIVVFNLAGACLPWTESRHRLAANAVYDQQLLAYLETQRVGAIAGSFWRVYPINFLSRERILAIPMQEGHDHYRVAEKLPASPLRWALVARNRRELAVWAGHAGLRGSFRTVSPLACVFLPDPNPPAGTPAEFQLRLKVAYNRPPSPGSG
ncbi:MAG TPA: hypothetical protein VHR45_12845 [Thermoanaerobaculia bacterium]|nr:hypothetical protein [Thermoanaerobaculia bacterium]